LEGGEIALVGAWAPPRAPSPATLAAPSPPPLSPPQRPPLAPMVPPRGGGGDCGEGGLAELRRAWERATARPPTPPLAVARAPAAAGGGGGGGSGGAPTVSVARAAVGASAELLASLAGGCDGSPALRALLGDVACALAAAAAASTPRPQLLVVGRGCAPVPSSWRSVLSRHASSASGVAASRGERPSSSPPPPSGAATAPQQLSSASSTASSSSSAGSGSGATDEWDGFGAWLAPAGGEGGVAAWLLPPPCACGGNCCEECGAGGGCGGGGGGGGGSDCGHEGGGSSRCVMWAVSPSGGAPGSARAAGAGASALGARGFTVPPLAFCDEEEEEGGAGGGAGAGAGGGAVRAAALLLGSGKCRAPRALGSSEEGGAAGSSGSSGEGANGSREGGGAGGEGEGGGGGGGAAAAFLRVHKRQGRATLSFLDEFLQNLEDSGGGSDTWREGVGLLPTLSASRTAEARSPGARPPRSSTKGNGSSR
jgi:hypothetical protein